MIGEISLGGVYVPTLLLIALAALFLSSLFIGLLGRIGAYRFLAYKALVDLAIVVLTFGALFLIAIATGFHP